jgi:hypothetical protein
MAGANMYNKTFQGFVFFRDYHRTWSFPREIERIIMDATGDGSVLHLYGGLARFGTRLDMDPATTPDVVGNALYPPFKCKSFDYVVMDPPYADLKAGVAMNIIIPAACLARKKVFWVHTHWPIRSGLGMRLNRWWNMISLLDGRADPHRRRVFGRWASELMRWLAEEGAAPDERHAG